MSTMRCGFRPFLQLGRDFGLSFGTASTKAYTTLGVSTGTRFAIGLGVEPSLCVVMGNVSRTTYRDFLDYALWPEREVRVGLSVSF